MLFRRRYGCGRERGRGRPWAGCKDGGVRELATPKPDAHPWWPSLFLAPALAATAVAAWGLSESTAYILDNPCVTGWGVPWAGPFTTLHSLRLLGAIAAVSVAFAVHGPKTRVTAVISLIVGVVLWAYAAGLMSAPYGWDCD